MGNSQDEKSGPVTQASGAGAAREPSWGDVLAYPLACVGAVVGAVVGGWVVYLAWRSSFYAVPLMGLAVGYGTTLLARKGGVSFGVIAALVTLAAQLFVEWKWLWRWEADDSLAFFVAHVPRLPGFHLLVHGVGVVLAYWIGWRR